MGERYPDRVLADERLLAYSIRINERLESLLPPASQRPERLHEAMRYSCLGPGKRLRPALTVAACESISGDEAMALNAACAVEMVHAFSLIHDDLPAIDNDALRRGRPTCHVVFGEAIAILAGDALFALALQTLAAMETSAEVRAESVLVLTKASGSDGLVGGEVVDVESEGAMIDPETLQYIHARKTGALISAACEIGALVGGASEKERATLRSFGTSIGLAFQIVDDILNETSTTDQLGKSVGSDRDRGKATYPALYGIDGARQFAKEAIEAGLGHLDQLSGPTEFLRSLSAFTLSRVH